MIKEHIPGIPRRDMYDGEPWAELVREIGFDPFDTESAARTVARHCAPIINELRQLIVDMMDDYDDESCSIHFMGEAGCVRCTENTTPYDKVTGLCAYHRAEEVVEKWKAEQHGRSTRETR